MACTDAPVYRAHSRGGSERGRVCDVGTEWDARQPDVVSGTIQSVLRHVCRRREWLSSLDWLTEHVVTPRSDQLRHLAHWSSLLCFRFIFDFCAVHFRQLQSYVQICRDRHKEQFTNRGWRDSPLFCVSHVTVDALFLEWESCCWTLTNTEHIVTQKISTGDWSQLDSGHAGDSWIYVQEEC